MFIAIYRQNTESTSQILFCCQPDTPRSGPPKFTYVTPDKRKDSRLNPPHAGGKNAAGDEKERRGGGGGHFRIPMPGQKRHPATERLQASAVKLKLAQVVLKKDSDELNPSLDLATSNSRKLSSIWNPPTTTAAAS